MAKELTSTKEIALNGSSSEFSDSGEAMNQCGQNIQTHCRRTLRMTTGTV